VVLLYSKNDSWISAYALRPIAVGEDIVCSLVPDAMLENTVLKRPVLDDTSVKDTNAASSSKETESDTGKNRPTEYMCVRGLYVAERLHYVCTCSRCKKDDLVLRDRLERGAVFAHPPSSSSSSSSSSEKTLSKKTKPIEDHLSTSDISSIMLRLDIASVKVDIPGVAREKHDNLYTHAFNCMNAMLRYGVINEIAVGLAPMRWNIARRFKDLCPFFAWHEAYEYLRAIVWGGGEITLTYAYSHHMPTGETFTSLSSSSTPSNPQPRNRAKRINQFMLNFTNEAIRTLIDRTLVSFRESEAHTLATVMAMSMVACVYGMSPTLHRGFPLPLNVLQHMNTPLVRHVLESEQGRLYRTNDAILQWYDAMMKSIAKERALVAALADNTPLPNLNA
jgi:hypothetical protein